MPRARQPSGAKAATKHDTIDCPVFGPQAGWQVGGGPGDAFDLLEVEHGADQRRAWRDVFLPGLVRPLGELFGGPPFPANHRRGALAFADMAALALAWQKVKWWQYPFTNALLRGQKRVFFRHGSYVNRIHVVEKMPPNGE